MHSFKGNDISVFFFYSNYPYNVFQFSVLHANKRSSHRTNDVIRDTKDVSDAIITEEMR